MMLMQSSHRTLQLVFIFVALCISLTKGQVGNSSDVMGQNATTDGDMTTPGAMGTPGQAGSPMPITAPTFPAGTNPQVTPIPESQLGSAGPTSQVFTQEFGDTFVPQPTPTPDGTASPTMSGGTMAVTQPPATVQIGLTGGVVAVAGLL